MSNALKPKSLLWMKIIQIPILKATIMLKPTIESHWI